jgi:hypothetical protein
MIFMFSMYIHTYNHQDENMGFVWQSNLLGFCRFRWPWKRQLAAKCTGLVDIIKHAFSGDGLVFQGTFSPETMDFPRSWGFSVKFPLNQAIAIGCCLGSSRDFFWDFESADVKLGPLPTPAPLPTDPG